MNKKQRKVLEKVFDRPTRSDIKWNEVKSLLAACGAEIIEGRGSRVRIIVNQQVLNLHRPHPQKELKKYVVELIKEFLNNIGVKP